MNEERKNGIYCGGTMGGRLPPLKNGTPWYGDESSGVWGEKPDSEVTDLPAEDSIPMGEDLSKKKEKNARVA
ncbi:MAG: hypothetical protein ACOZBZ_02195 [Patescibacteria group bacterium]